MKRNTLANRIRTSTACNMLVDGKEIIIIYNYHNVKKGFFKLLCRHFAPNIMILSNTFCHLTLHEAARVRSVSLAQIMVITFQNRMAQFSLYVHKGGLKPDSFHFIFQNRMYTLTNILHQTLLYVYTNRIFRRYYQRTSRSNVLHIIIE